MLTIHLAEAGEPWCGLPGPASDDLLLVTCRWCKAKAEAPLQMSVPGVTFRG